MCYQHENSDDRSGCASQAYAMMSSPPHRGLRSPSPFAALVLNQATDVRVPPSRQMKQNHVQNSLSQFRGVSLPSALHRRLRRWSRPILGRNVTRLFSSRKLEPTFHGGSARPGPSRQAAGRPPPGSCPVTVTFTDPANGNATVATSTTGVANGGKRISASWRYRQAANIDVNGFKLAQTAAAAHAVSVATTRTGKSPHCHVGGAAAGNGLHRRVRPSGAAATPGCAITGHSEPRPSSHRARAR